MISITCETKLAGGVATDESNGKCFHPCCSRSVLRTGFGFANCTKNGRPHHVSWRYTGLEQMSPGREATTRGPPNGTKWKDILARKWDVPNWSITECVAEEMISTVPASTFEPDTSPHVNWTPFNGRGNGSSMSVDVQDFESAAHKPSRREGPCFRKRPARCVDLVRCFASLVCRPRV